MELLWKILYVGGIGLIGLFIMFTIISFFEQKKIEKDIIAKIGILVIIVAFLFPPREIIRRKLGSSCDDKYVFLLQDAHCRLDITFWFIELLFIIIVFGIAYFFLGSDNKSE